MQGKCDLCQPEIAPVRCKPMEEQRIKTGMEIRKNLHKRLKLVATERGVPIWQLLDSAIEGFLSSLEGPAKVDPRATAYPYPENRVLHEKLEAILTSEDEGVVNAVVPNIEVFYDRMKPNARRKRRSG